MIRIPQVTLVCLTGKDRPGHEKAIEKSTKLISFGAVKLLWDESIASIDEWNRKVIQELPGYIETSHALLIHADGYVINPFMWDNAWLEYDYIGAPWPLPQDKYSYRDEAGDLVRVGNSVSLRSKKLMALVKTREWRSYYGNTNEDGFICCHNRKWLESQGCRFAPLDVAKYFSKEHELEENRDIKTFAFHKVD